MPQREGYLARAASRGLSARQWQDIRRAARIASSEGVKIELPSGAAVSGAHHQPDPERRQAKRQDEERRPTPSASAESNNANEPSKKQLRDEARARDKRAQPLVAKWQRFTSSLVVRAKITLINTIKLSLRHDEQKRSAQRLRLRAVLFRLYTSPNAACLATAQRVDQCSGGYGLTTCSLRDAYIYNLSKSFKCHLPLQRRCSRPMRAWLTHCESMDESDHSDDDFHGEGNLADCPPPTTRSCEDAGIKTPTLDRHRPKMTSSVRGRRKK